MFHVLVLEFSGCVLRLGKANYCFDPLSSWGWHLWELTRVVVGLQNCFL